MRCLICRNKLTWQKYDKKKVSRVCLHFTIHLATFPRKTFLYLPVLMKWNRFLAAMDLNTIFLSKYSKRFFMVSFWSLQVRYLFIFLYYLIKWHRLYVHITLNRELSFCSKLFVQENANSTHFKIIVHFANILVFLFVLLFMVHK